jgi:hypothetical protein
LTFAGETPSGNGAEEVYRRQPLFSVIFAIICLLLDRIKVKIVDKRNRYARIYFGHELERDRVHKRIQRKSRNEKADFIIAG